jgi:hypothetical protein
MVNLVPSRSRLPCPSGYLNIQVLHLNFFFNSCIQQMGSFHAEPRHVEPSENYLLVILRYWWLQCKNKNIVWCAGRHGAQV